MSRPALTDEKGEAAVAASLLSRLVSGPVVWVGGALSSVLILAVFVITIYAIVMRYFVNKPLLWADEVTGWLLVGIVMFGVAEAYRRGDHIAIDVLSSHARGAAKGAIAIVADIAVLGFSLVVGLSTWDAIIFARMFGSYTVGNIVLPTWILQTPILIGAVLLGLVAIVHLGERLLGYRRP